MLKAIGYAAQTAQTPLAPFAFERREPGIPLNPRPSRTVTRTVTPFSSGCTHVTSTTKSASQRSPGSR
ncbi:hypothetical protein GEV47_13695 [Glaciimonas sp. GS1]|uniref:Uncharacterized protein n=1 Tax=Glaciimonas soli TaxID=2590999 RepID=A0A843YW54_9BURK|nr:hypothetical protein [Glaciimonas soli]